MQEVSCTAISEVHVLQPHIAYAYLYPCDCVRYFRGSTELKRTLTESQHLQTHTLSVFDW